jgi:hypothetical protein
MAFAKSAVLLSLAIVAVAIVVHGHGERTLDGVVADVSAVLKAVFLPSTSSKASAAEAEEVLSLQGGAVKYFSAA